MTPARTYCWMRVLQAAHRWFVGRRASTRAAAFQCRLRKRSNDVLVIDRPRTPEAHRISLPNFHTGTGSPVQVLVSCSSSMSAAEDKGM